MTSKEALELLELILNNHSIMLEVDDNRMECINIIKQDLERLETLEKENKELWENIEKYNHTFASLERKKADLNQENEKLKKAISLLNLLFDFEIDIETETIYCCLGDVSVNGANLYEDFKLLKEVLGE
jgi:hypothetical protein